MPEELELEDDREDEDTEDTEEEDLEDETNDEKSEESDEVKDEKSKKHMNQKKWYTSAWLWVIIIAVVAIGAGLVWFFGYYAPAQNNERQTTQSEKALESDWSDLTSKTDSFVTQTNAIKTVDDFPTLSKNADLVLDVVKRSEDRANNQTTLDTKDYEIALEDINAYLLALQAILDKDYTKITSNDFDSIKDLGAEAKTSAEKFEENSDYIKDNISSDFFNTSITVKGVYDEKIAADEAASEAAKQAQQEEAQKLAREQDSVSAIVNNFMEEYIDANKDKIKNYMTSNFRSEFDYNKLDNPYYQPSSYRIIDTVKSTDTRYYVYGRLTEKQVGGSDQYSYDYNFTVLNDGGSWLVDVDSAPSR